MTSRNDNDKGQRSSTRKLYSVPAVLLVPLQEVANKPEPPPIYSYQSIYLVLGLLLLLAFLFYLVFRWWQRTEQASYLGQIFKESVFEFELSRRTKRVDERFNRGELERLVLASAEWKKKEYPKPPNLDDRLRPYVKSRHVGSHLPSRRPGSSTNPWDSDESYYLEIIKSEQNEELKGLFDDYKKALKIYDENRMNWERALEQAVNDMYQAELDNARNDAEKQTKRAANVDMGVFRGRGATFVLEFTAVVVIIFTAAILAILGKLGNEQVGTLLAAIAGYVLGRSVNPATEKEKTSEVTGNQDTTNSNGTNLDTAGGNKEGGENQKK